MGAGKTTLASALADRFPGSTVRAFGNVVRQRAVEEGRPGDRESLQQIGLEAIAEGWASFVGRLLAGAELATGGLYVIEGVRHLEAVEEIRRRFPHVPVRVVFLMVDNQTSAARLVERDGHVDERGRAIESDAWRLESIADRRLDAAQPVEELVEAVSRLVGE
jgi:dephospho-CoA kinase